MMDWMIHDPCLMAMEPLSFQMSWYCRVVQALTWVQRPVVRLADLGTDWRKKRVNENKASQSNGCNSECVPSEQKLLPSTDLGLLVDDGLSELIALSFSLLRSSHVLIELSLVGSVDVGFEVGRRKLFRCGRNGTLLGLKDDSLGGDGDTGKIIGNLRS